jgi:RNA polymerase sigma-70 factor, ECF subfamily
MPRMGAREGPMNPMDQSVVINEELLVADASQGNLQAFNELVLLYQNLAFQHAYAMLGDPAAAEDTAQESFIKAFQALDKFRGGSFRAWLLKIVTNTAYDLLRQSTRHSMLTLFPEDENGDEFESPSWIVDPTASVQAAVEQSETSREIYRKMDELPAVYRSVLTLIDLYEMDYEEAAQALNVPLGTIKSRLARARLQMQKKLKNTVRLENCYPGSAGCLAA